MGALVQTFSNLFSSQFREKTLGPHHFFFTSTPSNQTPSKNIFSLLFSHFYFYPPYFTSNQTDLSIRKGNYASSLSEEEEGQCSSPQILG